MFAFCYSYLISTRGLCQLNMLYPTHLIHLCCSDVCCNPPPPLSLSLTHTHTHILSLPLPPSISLFLLQPSVLALAVLGCDLKLLGCDWLSTILSLQTFARIKGGELSICYEAVVPHYAQIASQYPLFIGVRRSADSSSATDKVRVNCEGKEQTADLAHASDELPSVVVERDTSPSTMAAELEPPPPPL